jgi:hypothetical protein
MRDNAQGGNDSLSATGSSNRFFGDARFMSGDAVGGNDSLIATGSGNRLYGDATEMSGDAEGGNDRLIGGNGGDLVVGDASYMYDNVVGGDDQLWGDAVGAATGGADTFLFTGAIGQDIVFDFRPDDGDNGDVVELKDYGFDDVGDLSIDVAGGSTVIDIGASLGQTANVDTIRLAGFNDSLTNGDFLFT